MVNKHSWEKPPSLNGPLVPTVKPNLSSKLIAETGPDVCLEVFINICTVLLRRCSLCAGGDNDAGKYDDRCFAAGDGANSCHLRCIMATLIHVNTENKKQLDNYNTTRQTQSYCSSLNLMFLSENTELDLCPEKNNRSGKKCWVRGYV